jgi:aminopeptidase N
MNLRHLGLSSNFTLPGAETHYAPDLLLTTSHLEIRLRVDLDAHAADVKAIHSLTAKAEGVREIELDAVELDIIKIEDLDGRATRYSYDGDKIRIKWEEAYAEGETRRLQVTYQVIEPIGGMSFGGPTPESPERGRWMATDHETQRARYWLPCIDHSSVRMPLDIYVEHESDLTCLGPGEMMSQTEEPNGFTTTHWKLEQRSPSYLLCIAVGEFVKWDGGEFNGKPIAAFAPKPCSVETLERCFGPTKGLLEMITPYLGPLPWSKYYQFAMPGIGGAMENISLVSWDEFWLFDEAMHQDLGRLFDQVNLHELAHTWFGNLVVCRDYAHVWLKESWATYMEVVWFEKTHGADETHFELLTKRRRYFSESKSQYSRPIMTRKFDTPWQMYDAHLYPGGAVRLHMLRDKLGDDVFWRAVRSYVDTYAGKVVETSDFRRVMEEHSGYSLAEFFAQWFERAGHPKLKLSSRHHSESGNFRISIEQSSHGGPKDAPPFRFPLELAIEVSEGSWEMHSIDLEEKRHVLRIPMAEAPLQVVVDPSCKAVVELEYDPGKEMLARSLQHSPYIYGKIHAAETLVKSGRRSALNIVGQALEDEAFWGVRKSIVSALGKSKTPFAEAILISSLESEKMADALHSTCVACGEHRSKEMAAALTAFLHRSDVPYRARGAALSALGRQNEHCDWDILLAAAEDDGWQHFLRRNAVAAVAKTRSERGARLLIERMQSPDESIGLRASAAVGLAACVSNLDRAQKAAATEALIELLQADSYRLRLAAARGLTALPSRKAISPLESIRGTLCAQDHPLIDRAVSAARKNTEDSTGSKMQKRVEDLEEQLKKLLARIEELEADAQNGE